MGAGEWSCHDAPWRTGNAYAARKASGKPWDHVHELRDAQRGLVNRIGAINARLSRGNLDPIERAALQDELSQASRLLDLSEGYLSR